MRRAHFAILILCLTACSSQSDDDDGPAPWVDAEGRVLPLACPGDPGCDAAAGPLSVGAAARAVSPEVEPFEDLDGDGRYDEGEPFEDRDGDGVHDEVWIGGFGMDRPALAVHDDIWARAIVLEQGDLQVGLVVVDVVGWFHDDALKVRAAARAAGVPLDHLVVASTHNHEGPDTMGLWGPNPGTTGRDLGYQARVVAAAAAAVAAAWSRRQPATLTWAQVDLPDLVHDSRRPEVKDALATALRFDGADGPLAVLTVWGNHPEALGGSHREITSDFPHYLRRDLEAAYPGATALFFPGNLGGLMNPLGVTGCPDEAGEPTCFNGDYEKAEYIGSGAAEGILAALASGEARTVERPDLRARRAPLFLTPQNILFFAGWAAGLVDRRLFSADEAPLSRAEAERFPLEEVEQGILRLQTEVGAVGIGPLELVTVPGELYPELWLTGPGGESFVTFPEGRDFPDAPAEPPLAGLVPDGYVPVCLNQANDALGYLIPKPQFDRESPRAYGGQYGEQNSIGPDAPAEIAEAVRAMYAR